VGLPSEPDLNQLSSLRGLRTLLACALSESEALESTAPAGRDSSPDSGSTLMKSSARLSAVARLTTSVSTITKGRPGHRFFTAQSAPGF
jgi:hypothetical protein